MSEYQRVLDWATKTGHGLKVTKHSSSWSIAVAIYSPVQFESHSSGQTIDQAASQLTADLETAAGRKLEEITD